MIAAMRRLADLRAIDQQLATVEASAAGPRDNRCAEHLDEAVAVRDLIATVDGLLWRAADCAGFADMDRVFALFLAKARTIGLAPTYVRYEEFDRARDVVVRAVRRSRVHIAGMIFEAECAQGLGDKRAFALNGLALRILLRGVMVLPIMCRARYMEEYRAELADLVEHGASWRKQILYAFRVASRAWMLRRALLVGRRTEKHVR